MKMLAVVLCASLLHGEQTPKPTAPDPSVRRVCIDAVDVRVGDALEELSKALKLTRDDGTADDGVSPRSLGETVVYAGPEFEHTVANGSATLRATSRFAFDDRHRLRSVTLFWSLDPGATPDAAESAWRYLVEHVHRCFRGRTATLHDGTTAVRTDYGTYSEELTSGWRDGRWRAVYEIRQQP